MATKTVPHPGYATAKPWLSPFQTLFKDLGEQDACIQMQEISQCFLEATSKGMGTKIDDFVRLLYQAHQVPHGTYDFGGMRDVAHRSYIVLTYASFEAALKESIEAYKTRTGNAWNTKNGLKGLAPLQQIPFNMPASSAGLQAAPEYRLLEYYRLIRVAESHRTPVTAAAANAAYAQLTSADLKHFRNYAHIKGAPNPSADINFEDFKLFTRAVKYYCHLLNEALA